MEKTQSFFICVLKGILCATIISLISVFIFAFIVKIAYLDNGVIKAVNQFIKVLSVFLACSFCLPNKSGLIGGALIGAISSIVIFLLFALFLGQVDFGFNFLVEIIFMLVIGGVSGIISVNLKK